MITVTQFPQDIVDQFAREFGRVFIAASDRRIFESLKCLVQGSE